MKKTLLIFLLLSTFISAQTLPLLEKLDSPDFGDRYAALKTIKDESLIEYIPELENRIFLQESFQIQYEYLVTLNALSAENCYSLLNKFYANLDTVTFDVDYDITPTIELKVMTNSLYFKYSDFSKVDVIFEYLKLNKSDCTIVLNDLEYVYLTLPAYRNQVKQELLKIFKNTGLQYYLRKTAIEILAKTDYEDIATLCINTINSSSEEADLKIPCIRILYHNSYNGLRELLRQNIPIQESDFIRYQMTNHLLSQFGYPSDLYLIIDYYPNEPDEVTRSLIQHSIVDFIPPRPTVTTSEMIDTLISFTSQLLQYNWIKDSTNYKSYLTELKNQKKLYIERDEDNLNDSIEHFLEMVEDHHKPELLTEEGYKYLYYYATYIKENVDEEF
jgi:hypothetical protein